MNFGKTEFMVLNAGPGTPDKLYVGDKHIERASTFVYLGSYFSDGSGAAELEAASSFDLAPAQSRLRLADRRFREMGAFFRSRADIKLKVAAFNAFVWPVASWGCGTWTLKDDLMYSLDTWHRKKLRIMLGITKKDHVTIEQHYKATGASPLSGLIWKRRLRYVGHVARYPETRWARTFLDGDVAGGRRSSKWRTWQKCVKMDMQRLNARWGHCMSRELWPRIISGELNLERDLGNTIRAAARGRSKRAARNDNRADHRLPERGGNGEP